MNRFNNPEELQRALGWDRQKADEPVERMHLRS